MLMPWRVTGGIALLLATGAATLLAITITFRNGATQTGEIVRMNDTNLTLKTSLGEKTYLWRALKNESIQGAHPALYTQLLATAQARQQPPPSAPINQPVPVAVAARGAGPAASAPEDLRTVRLGVDTDLKKSGYRRTPISKNMKKSGWDTVYKRTCHGNLVLQLRGLNATKTYGVRTTFAVHLKGARKGDLAKKTTVPTQIAAGTAALTLTNQASARLDFLTQPYREQKWRALESDGTSTATTTFDADYWDIKVWINETLVYSEENGNKPGYFHVQKL